jgi:hypothetical protein
VWGSGGTWQRKGVGEWVQCKKMCTHACIRIPVVTIPWIVGAE